MGRERPAVLPRRAVVRGDRARRVLAPVLAREVVAQVEVPFLPEAPRHHQVMRLVAGDAQPAAVVQAHGQEHHGRRGRTAARDRGRRAATAGPPDARRPRIHRPRAARGRAGLSGLRGRAAPAAPREARRGRPRRPPRPARPERLPISPPVARAHRIVRRAPGLIRPASSGIIRPRALPPVQR